MIEVRTDPEWQFKDRFKVIHIINKNRFSSYKELGKQLGVSEQTIYKYINGKSLPGIDVILKVKQMIPEINLNWLLVGEGEMYVKPQKIQ